MTDELPPIRCVTCNKMIADKWKTYENLISNGVRIEDALTRVGLRRQCCRLRLRNPFKVVERAVQNNPNNQNKTFEDNFDSLSISIDSEAPTTGALSSMTDVTSMTIMPEEKEEIILPPLPSLPPLGKSTKIYRTYKAW